MFTAGKSVAKMSWINHLTMNKCASHPISSSYNSLYQYALLNLKVLGSTWYSIVSAVIDAHSAYQTHAAVCDGEHKVQIINVSQYYMSDSSVPALR